MSQLNDPIFANDELAPCPFCGGEAVLTDVFFYGTRVFRCRCCQAIIGFPPSYAKTDAEAKRAWNRRVELIYSKRLSQRPNFEEHISLAVDMCIGNILDIIKDAKSGKIPNTPTPEHKNMYEFIRGWGWLYVPMQSQDRENANKQTPDTGKTTD